jgi:hypothetical protein
MTGIAALGRNTLPIFKPPFLKTYFFGMCAINTLPYSRHGGPLLAKALQADWKANIYWILRIFICPLYICTTRGAEGLRDRKICKIGRQTKTGRQIDRDTDIQANRQTQRLMIHRQTLRRPTTGSVLL